MTEYLARYGEINEGAHRKAAELVGAPALVWHLGYWNPPSAEIPDQNVPNARDPREVRRERISRFVQHLCGGLTDVVYVPVSQPGQPARRQNSGVVSIQFYWEGVKCIVRVENHTEYVTITSIIDASILSLPPGISDPTPDAPGQYELYALLKRNFDALRAGTHRLTDTDEPVFSDAKDVQNFLYRGIWERFFERILNKNLDLARLHYGQWQQTTEFGGRFVDLRGLITCEPYPPDDKGKASEPKDLATLHLEQGPIETAFHKTKADTRNQWQRTTCPPEDWARRRLDNAWPFLSEVIDDQLSPHGTRTEFTVSRIAEGRILYATALGPQPEDVGAALPERPLFFFMHSVTQCERQIGRAVDTLCTLGTLRLASIIALPNLRNVGPALARIAHNIADTRILIHKLVGSSRNLSSSERIDSERAILDRLSALQKMIADLTTGAGVGEQGELGSATLDYRMVRSRYYMSLFESQIKLLRIIPLEGYQPYDLFILRRLDSVFKFIESTAARVIDMRREWRALDQYYLNTAVTMLTLEMRELQLGDRGIQRNIEQLLTQIDNQQRQFGQVLSRIDRQQDQANLILAGIDSTDHELGKIQKWGEYFLIGFLLPYYISSLVMHIFNCSLDDWCAKSRISVPYLWSFSYEQGIAGALFLACLVIAYKGLESMKRFLRRVVGTLVRGWVLKGRV